MYSNYNNISNIHPNYNSNNVNNNFFSGIIDNFNFSNQNYNNANNNIHINNNSNMNNNSIGPQYDNRRNFNNNNSQGAENSIFGNIGNTISNALGELGNNMINLASSILNSGSSNNLIPSNSVNNSHSYFFNNNRNVVNFPIPRIDANPSMDRMNPNIPSGYGPVSNPNNPNNGFNNNISNEDLNRIMECLPSIVINEKNEGENNNCVICIGDFEPGESITTLPCLHRFHTDCIKSWLQSRNHCPVCKFEITLDSIRREN